MRVFTTVGRRGDPESLFRHLLAGCLLVAGLECAGFSWLCWVVAKLVYKLVLVVLGLLFPGVPDLTALPAPVDMVEVVLEDPPEVTEADIPVWDPTRDEEPEPSEVASGERVAVAQRAAYEEVATMGVLAILSTGGDGSDESFASIWGSGEGLDLDSVLIGSSGLDSALASEGGVAVFGSTGLTVGSGEGAGGLGMRGSDFSSGGGGASARVGGLATRGTGPPATSGARVGSDPGALGRGRLDESGAWVETTRPEVVSARISKRVEPRYPREARQAGLGEATCRYVVMVDADGEPVDPYIVVSCPEPFREAVEKAIGRCRWEPATADGEAVGDDVELVFELRP